MKQLTMIIALILFALPAAAQNTITFSADTTTAIGQVTPVLTWDTSPLADDCTASGSWSGQKGGAGNATLETITSSATYALTCEWINDSVTLTWVAPTQNTDGSALIDLDGYKLYYSTQLIPPVESVIDIDNASVTTYVVDSLAAGTWHFRATSINAIGIESAFSEAVSRVVTGTADSSESVSITVNAQPAPPTALTAN